MGSALHFILLLSGLWTLTVEESRQFYLVNTRMKWSDAQAHCRAIYTDLATIESEEEMNTVRAMVKGIDNFWIGMKQINSNCCCSASYNNKFWVWSDQSCVSYTDWDAGEPNSGVTGNCVQILKYSNKWNDALCTEGDQFVCYKKRTPLIVIKKQKTWREALWFCRQNHVDLVSVQSQEMQDWVGVVTQNAFTNVTRVWVGLRYTCSQGFWYWVAGEPICYQNWAPGNGTGVEDCGDVERTGAMLSDSKKWISLPETQKLPFICVTT